MPICKECNCSFPQKKWVDKKYLDLRRRVYCLDCSPFGLRKKCGPKPKPKNNEPKFCTKCGRKHTSKNNLVCSTCRCAKLRNNNKNKCLEIKGNKCQKCGYDKCKKALSFHHRDPKEKNFNLSSVWHMNWELLEKEFQKCDLLCLNCHAEEYERLEKEK